MKYRVTRDHEGWYRVQYQMCPGGVWFPVKGPRLFSIAQPAGFWTQWGARREMRRRVRRARAERERRGKLLAQSNDPIIVAEIEV